MSKFYTEFFLEQSHTITDKAGYTVSVNDELHNPLVYLPLGVDREMNFICESETFVVQEPCKFEDAAKFCEKTGSRLLTQMSKEQKKQWKEWVEETYGFYQVYRPMLWSDMVMINNTHYQSIYDEREYKTLHELNITGYANPRVVVYGNGKLRNLSELTVHVIDLI